MQAFPMPAPPLLLQDHTGDFLHGTIPCDRRSDLYPRSCFKFKNENQVRPGARGTALQKSHVFVLGNWQFPNINANHGVILIRNLELDVMLLPIMFRQARNLKVRYSCQELFQIC